MGGVVTVAGNDQVANPNPPRRSGKCHLLLLGLVALLILFPLVEDINRPVIQVMCLTLPFLAGVLVAETGRTDVRRAFVLAAIQLGLAGISFAVPEKDDGYPILLSIELLATVVLILFSTRCLGRYILRSPVITRDQIYAGVCMYIMLGFAFAALFYILNTLSPGSFSAGDSTEQGERPAALIYFSFVTLATLGYGDITPRSHFARSLSVIEALVGMLFIAIFMARLVSMRTDRDK
jgi:hypothetical protein